MTRFGSFGMETSFPNASVTVLVSDPVVSVCSVFFVVVLSSELEESFPHAANDNANKLAQINPTFSY